MVRIRRKKRASKKTTSQKTLGFVFFCFSLCLIALVARLAWIQLVEADELKERAQLQWERNAPLLAPRGTIYDSSGQILANNITLQTIVAAPDQIDDAKHTAQALASVLDIDKKSMIKTFEQDRKFAYVKRKIDNEKAEKVKELNLAGINFIPENKRIYPNDNLASHVLGFVGTDEGLAGLESYYEDSLQGQDGQATLIADNLGKRVPPGITQITEPEPGSELVLTIDRNIQYIIEKELKEALEKYDAKGVHAIAANPNTGEILAMAQKPDFNPNNYSKYPDDLWKIDPVLTTYEPGSTFKLATLAAAIEENQYRATKEFYCPGYKEVTGHTIRCSSYRDGGHEDINYLEAATYSCNVGFMKMGNELEAETLFDYIHAFGFGEQTGIDLPGEGRGILFNPENIYPTELATTTFGQGVSVTPIQQVMAFSAMINGGELLKPYVVKELRNGEKTKITEPQVSRKVISPDTSKQIRKIAEMVVSEGSGANAYSEDYSFGGKTGTAQKVEGGVYQPGKNIMSFIGFAPVENPEIVLFVTIDENRDGPNWASLTAAPLFRDIMENIMNYLGTPKQRNETATVTEIPDIEGLTIEEARHFLNTCNLSLKILEGREDEDSVIVEQFPKPDTKVPFQYSVLVKTEKGGL